METDGGAVVVKMTGTTAAGRSLAHEAFVYRLASWQPGLAAVLPPALLIDESRGVIVTQAAPREAVASSLMDGTAPPPQVCRALGRTLGALHAATSDAVIPFPGAAGVLDLPVSEEKDLELRHAVSLAVSIGRDPLLGPHLTAARAAWAPSCLVHADVKWDNCLVEDPHGEVRLRLIDWEMSGWGDPAWDVAAALAQLSSLSTVTRRSTTEHQQALLRDYPERQRAEVIPRVPAFWAARVVHLALECAEAGAEETARSLLQHACDLVRSLAAVGHELDTWAR